MTDRIASELDDRFPIVTADECRLLRVDAVYTYDSRYRTAEGRLGVGSRIASVIDGDRSITFWLGGLDGAGASRVVSAVKVSHRDFAGNDEGCA